MKKRKGKDEKAESVFEIIWVLGSLRNSVLLGGEDNGSRKHIPGIIILPNY
jgi:hypothetical protein